MTTEKKVKSVLAGTFVGIGFIPMCAYIACRRTSHWLVETGKDIGHEALDILIPASTEGTKNMMIYVHFKYAIWSKGEDVWMLSY